MSDSGREWLERAAAVADPERPPAELPSVLVHEIFLHSRECYPEEACGLLLGPPGGPPTRIERCTNVQTRRKLDGLSELDARHGYWIDERELLRALRRAEEEGSSLLVIYHSHVDTEAYFSETDRDAALGPDGRPLWPGVAQLVLSVYEDGVRDMACFVWAEDVRGFVGQAVRQVAE